MNAQEIAESRNEWIKQVWTDTLPGVCVRAGYIPEWARRAPMWSNPEDFDIEKPIVICGINPGYNSKKQDAVCRLPTGYLPRMVAIDKRDHKIITESNTHRYFGPYRRLIGENIRFYDLLPMRESSMASVRNDYKKGFGKFIDHLVHAHMNWLRLSRPEIVWMHTAWAMELIGCKDLMQTKKFSGKPAISDHVNCYNWPHHNGTTNEMPDLLLFKGDQLCGTRSASIPTRNRLLRDFQKCTKDLGLIWYQT